ncbi:ATP-binding cassette subfamily B protein [Natranaerovirga hydrolytica]|uniref:ATP-binding cassette subfamily B protein n=1 Tax=Natranaerovirga hydrolytica TaxID=680378 RepID=A0A4R1M897_9FIRM|nr:ABC transporter ATP-binding protein [Natranaerovirga hydrolytica]TCK88017.1 ATP-binding cassette subfamily B protein [Natranaerovirga hydrolytica]
MSKMSIKSKVTRKPNDALKTIKRILAYLSEYKLSLIVVFICIVLSALAQVIGISFLKVITDNYLTPMLNEYDSTLMMGFIRIIIFMAAVFLIGAISTYVFSRVMLRVSTKTLYNIRVQLFSKMQSLPIKYFDTHTHGDLMSLYTNDIDTLRQMLSNSVANFISAIITITGVFVMMVYFSWELTLIVILMIFIMLRTVKVVGGKSASFFVKQQQELGAVNGYIEEMIEGQKVVKVFSYEDQAKANFKKLNDSLCEAATSANGFANILMPILNNMSYVNYGVTAIAGGAMVLTGRLSLGVVVAFLQFTRTFSQPISQISQQLNVVLTALAGAERIFKVLDEKPEEDTGYVTLVNAKILDNGEIIEVKERTGVWAWKHPHKDGTVSYTQVKGDIVFDQVVFGYDEDEPVLKGISLYAKPGQKIALVGSTGAGKTTITNLINRFYDVPEGKIRYDGININKIKKSDLRRSLSMVLQDTHLFTGTVMDNIRYGKLDATDEEVIAAAKLANAHTFIKHLPQGYDTVLTSDGHNLSQGQRQLLSIARAAVANPPVLILDEATSSIDTRTERLIQKGMNRLMEGRTAFIIAHRLSTIRNSDAIMVLEHGEIIERGNHEELIEQKGRYYQLASGMFELS